MAHQVSDRVTLADVADEADEEVTLATGGRCIRMGDDFYTDGKGVEAVPVSPRQPALSCMPGDEVFIYHVEDLIVPRYHVMWCHIISEEL